MQLGEAAGQETRENKAKPDAHTSERSVQKTQAEHAAGVRTELVNVQCVPVQHVQHLITYMYSCKNTGQK